MSQFMVLTDGSVLYEAVVGRRACAAVLLPLAGDDKITEVKLWEKCRFSNVQTILFGLELLWPTRLATRACTSILAFSTDRNRRIFQS